MQRLRSWNVTSPGRIAVDTDSTLWVMSGVALELTIQHYAPNGARSPALALPAGAVPVDIAVTPAGQILVADNGPSQQILVFNKDANGQPQAVRRSARATASFTRSACPALAFQRHDGYRRRSRGQPVRRAERRRAAPGRIGIGRTRRGARKLRVQFARPQLALVRPDVRRQRRVRSRHAQFGLHRLEALHARLHASPSATNGRTRVSRSTVSTIRTTPLFTSRAACVANRWCVESTASRFSTRSIRARTI